MKQTIEPFSIVRSVIANTAFVALTTTSLWGINLTGNLIHSAKAELKDSPKAIVDEVWQIVNNEFVGREFDREAWKQKRTELLSQEYSTKEEAYNAIRESLKTLGDPYTRFLGPRQFEQLTNQTTGELSGIGIRLELDKESNALTVLEALDNSPAKEGGVQAGDRILRIDNQSTALMNLEEATELIRGEEGTNIRLQLSRPNKGLFELTLTRAQVEVPVLHYSLKEEGKLRVGYMKLDEFSSHAAEQMKKAITYFHKNNVQGFVLDLRGNPGGLLFASVDIARMWMETGDIVRTVDRKGGDRKYSANKTSITKLPLVVLVDGSSASASEILAGALKDNGRATLIGTRTYGKGTVQSVHSLSDDSGLAVTISRYYPPSGVNINKHGIAPDILVDLTQEQQRQLRINPKFGGTGNDPQYLRALGILQERHFGGPPATKPVSIRQQIN